MVITIITTGARTGYTGRLGGVRFVNGVGVVEGAGAVTYMGRSYKAFPQGSKALKTAQEEDAKNPKLKGLIHGASKVHPGEGDGPDGHIPGGVQSSGQGSSTVPPTLGSGDDGPSSGGEGGISGGDGHQDPRDDGETGKQNSILEAMTSLDADNSELWTHDGRPRIDAIEAASGLTGLTRADVQAVDPDFRRPSDD